MRWLSLEEKMSSHSILRSKTVDPHLSAEKDNTINWAISRQQRDSRRNNEDKTEGINDENRHLPSNDTPRWAASGQQWRALLCRRPIVERRAVGSRAPVRLACFSRGGIWAWSAFCGPFYSESHIALLTMRNRLLPVELSCAYAAGCFMPLFAAKNYPLITKEIFLAFIGWMLTLSNSSKL